MVGRYARIKYVVYTFIIIVFAIQTQRSAERFNLCEVDNPLYSPARNGTCVHVFVGMGIDSVLLISQLLRTFCARKVVECDDTGRAIDFKLAVGNSHSHPVQATRTGVFVGDRGVVVDHHVRIERFVVKRRDVNARTFDVHFHSDVGLIGVLPLQIGVV